MRARGLKQQKLLGGAITASVAPHAGAWIETLPYGCLTRIELVAPHAGAWIETQRPAFLGGDEFFLFSLLNLFDLAP